MNGSRPPGLVGVGVLGGGVLKVTPSTVGVTDGFEVGPPPPAGQAGLLGLVVSNACWLASGIVSKVGPGDGPESVARAIDGVVAIPALSTSAATIRIRRGGECTRMAAVSAHDPGGTVADARRPSDESERGAHDVVETLVGVEVPAGEYCAIEHSAVEHSAVKYVAIDDVAVEPFAVQCREDGRVVGRCG